MSGLDLNKVKKTAVNNLLDVIGDNLSAVILTGSASQNTYKVGWSDIDLLVVVSKLDFDTKRRVAKVVTKLESNSGIHHGVYVITSDEFFNPIIPEVFLDGKTLQALIDLKKYPNRIIYSKEYIDLQKVYSPDDTVLRNYSLSSIAMFLRRNRRTLTTAEYGTKNLKELLKKEMRASLIMTKLAVQYFTSAPQENYQDALCVAKSMFPDFDFRTIEEIFQVINKWQEFNNKDELLTLFHKIDTYIENFARYIFQKANERTTKFKLTLPNHL